MTGKIINHHYTESGLPNVWIWIPASLHLFVIPPSAEMMNSSGENDGCLLFPPFAYSSFLQKSPTPSSSPAGGDPGGSNSDKD